MERSRRHQQAGTSALGAATAGSNSSGADVASCSRNSASADRTRSTSSIITKPLCVRRKPVRYSAVLLPNAGGGSIWSARSSITSFTPSAIMPMVVSWPSKSMSTTITHVCFVTSRSAMPKRTARSTTGSTVPRRFSTPRTQAGMAATRVRVENSMISLTRRIVSAYSSAPRWNVRYCFSSVAISFSICPLLSHLGLEVRESASLPGACCSGLGVPVRFHHGSGHFVRHVPCWRMGEVWNRLPRRTVISNLRLRSRHLEKADQLLQRFRLRRQFLSGARQLFGGRSVTLREFVHLRHGAIDLRHAGRLLMRCTRDFLHDLGGLGDRRHEVCK